MRVVEKISDLKAIIKSQKSNSKTIGFVPTMGYLHQGHLSLVETSKYDNDFTIISIFVNPTQFGPNEDFNKYPRDTEKDLIKAENAGVDIVFLPNTEDMYPNGFMTYVNVDEITNKLCGKSRPGHFKGVTTVVNKLFNIVQPNKAYFGQKDAQQVAVIKRMVCDLNMNIEIITCPIVREEDGLAMSSRNIYLNSEERKFAINLSKALFGAKEMITNGETSKQNIIEYITNRIINDAHGEVEYVEILNAETLEDISIIENKILLALAAKIGAIRLIDNIVVDF